MQGVFIYAAILPVVVIIHWAAVPARWRSLYLLLCSLGFIASYSWTSALYFLANIAVVHQACRYLSHKERARRPAVLKLTLLWLIGSLCVFKYTNILVDAGLHLALRLSLVEASSQLSLPQILLPLGISYIIFRLIHCTVESYRGRLPKEYSLVDLACYVLFFPTFLSGPVERFPAFHCQTAAQQDFDFNHINYGLFRILSGAVKKVGAADPLLSLVMPVLRAPAAFSRGVVVSSIYGLAVQVYMDFSGYTDLALGVSRLFGYKIMENFNLPYFRPNLAEVWRNWHISVYSFIRDYFFFPLFAVRGSALKLHVGIFLTFVVFMIWHDGSLRFLALGVYHGVGMVIWNLFQLLKRKSPSASQLISHPDLGPLHTFIAVSFFGFGFIFFVLEMAEVRALMLRFFI